MFSTSVEEFTQHFLTLLSFRKPRSAQFTLIDHSEDALNLLSLARSSVFQEILL